MKLKCKRCGYEWNYQGQAEYYACCSRCKISIPIKKLREQQSKENNK